MCKELCSVAHKVPGKVKYIVVNKKDKWTLIIDAMRIAVYETLFNFREKWLNIVMWMNFEYPG